ncbi:MAG: DUF3024 domain-containing protein [Desulfobulbaceae bacterium]|nr:DUF3024 domain-containing protein [Desulfobulbaceae bacterium]
MSISEFEQKRTEKLVGAFVEKHRPESHIRPNLDLSFRFKNQSVEIFEIRPVWNKPKEKIDIPIAKATYVKTRQCWRVFWLRSDLKWHRYEPNPEVRLIEDFLVLVEQDEFGCFFG